MANLLLLQGAGICPCSSGCTRPLFFPQSTFPKAAQGSKNPCCHGSRFIPHIEGRAPLQIIQDSYSHCINTAIKNCQVQGHGLRAGAWGPKKVWRLNLQILNKVELQPLEDRFGHQRAEQVRGSHFLLHLPVLSPLTPIQPLPCNELVLLSLAPVSLCSSP